jgi:light-regulated signal transduction histidine kinase (bacteriophytochrome)
MFSTYTQLLVEQYSGTLENKAAKYIHYAVDDADHMAILIRDLLEFCRIRTAEVALKNTDSEEIIRRVIKVSPSLALFAVRTVAQRALLCGCCPFTTSNRHRTP